MITVECPVLESKKHMEFSCFYLGDRIDCHGKLPAGAKVRPRCAPYYREDYSNFDTIECESNGKWTNKLFNCIPGYTEDCILTWLNIISFQYFINTSKQLNFLRDIKMDFKNHFFNEQMKQYL